MGSCAGPVPRGGSAPPPPTPEPPDSDPHDDEDQDEDDADPGPPPERRGQYFCIKTGLRGLLRMPELQPVIDDAVHRVSQIIWELSKFLQLLYLRCCELDLPIPRFRRGTDFYILCQGLSTCTGGRNRQDPNPGLLDFSMHPDPVIQAAAEAQHIYWGLRPDDLPWASRDCIAQPLKSASQVHWDNCSQNVVANFDRYLLKWWKAKVGSGVTESGTA